MQTYSSFQPTGFDPTGLNLPDRQEWLVCPSGRNRDSGLVAESNFHATLKALGDESETVEVHRFGHWACGWLEIILVDPESLQAAIAQDIERGLEDYCLVDETDYSKREYEKALEAIEQVGGRYTVDHTSDDWTSDVFSWLWENDQRALENVDDQGPYPTEEQIISALRALGILDLESVA